MKELNYDEMEEEHQELLRVIRTTHGEGIREPEERLKLTAEAPQTLDTSCDDDTDQDDPVGRLDGQVMQCSVRLTLDLLGTKPVENVTVTIKAPACFLPSLTSYHLETLKQGQPHVITVVFRVLTSVLCNGLDVLACALIVT